jgi:DNA-binding MarR family transcriptional regulator
VTAGFLNRADDPTDRRHLVLSLTAEGKRLLESLMSHRRSVLAAIVAAMKEDDRRSLARGMAAFRESAEHASTTAPLEDDQGHLLRWLG